jgi:hypothetical protein
MAESDRKHWTHIGFGDAQYLAAFYALDRQEPCAVNHE